MSEDEETMSTEEFLQVQWEVIETLVKTMDEMLKAYTNLVSMYGILEKRVTKLED